MGFCGKGYILSKYKNKNLMGQIVIFLFTVKGLFRKAKSRSAFPIDLKMCIYKK